MKSTVYPSTLAASSAIAAAVAALTLTACGPKDNSEVALATASTQASSTTAAAAPTLTEPAARSAPALQGTPVPPAPRAPEYAPRPTYPAQSSYPAPLAPNAYAPQPNYVVERHAAEAAADSSRIGSVSSIEPIRERPQGSGAGAVIGGVLGAVVGNQFGHGAGRAGMTGAGAVGGAIAGNNLERNHRETITGYRVSIRLDNGTTRSFKRSEIRGLQVGDRVKLDAGSFRRV